VILKSFIVEKNINSLDLYTSVLIYGVNTGIKEDLKLRIKSLNKDAEIINLFEDFILKNKSVLYENILNQSLFSKKKIIFIYNATDKLLDEIEQHLENKNVKIFIFSDNLDKKSKLRSTFEKSQILATFACYEDTEKTLVNYINNELKNYKGLTGDICNLIISNCNMNRRDIQNELEKVKTLFQDKQINKNKLLELLNQKSNINFEEIRDKALVGEKEKVNKLLSQVDFLNEESFYYLNSISSRIQKLIDIKNILGSKNIEIEIDNLRQPIFWKDKPIYIKQLKKWSLNKLTRIYSKINAAETLMKKNSYINNSVIIKNLLTDISSENVTSF
jgi:DNA polymerase-3 subunit delta